MELKGGGVNASAKQPWQAYRAVSGHFDRLANDLETCLLARRADVEKNIGSKKRALAGGSVTRIGAPFMQTADAPHLSSSAFHGTSTSLRHGTELQADASDAGANELTVSRQLQFIAKREGLLAKGQGAGASSATAKSFKSRAELAIALQADWNAILAAQNLIM